MQNLRLTNGNQTSHYTIESFDYDDEEVIYQLFVIKDDGTDYDLTIDGLNALVIFLSFKDDGQILMDRYYINDVVVD